MSNNQEPYLDDDINVKQLVNTIIKARKLVIGLTALSILAATATAFILPSAYQAKAIFLPPTEADLAALMIPNVPIPSLTGTGTGTGTSEIIYQKFKEQLSSSRTHQTVFSELNLISKDDSKDDDNLANLTALSDSIVVKEVIPERGQEKKTVPFLSIAFTHSDAVLSAQVVNKISQEASKNTVNNILSAIKEEVSNRQSTLLRDIESLKQTITIKKADEVSRLKNEDELTKRGIEDQINVLRASAKEKRQDQIAQLTEAANIANSIGLIEKSSLLDYNATQESTGKSTVYTEVTMTPPPLYLQGEKALRSQIKELETRKSDDPFIPELRGLQEKLELLKNNRKIESLVERKDDNPFIEGLREKEAELARLESIKLSPENIKVVRFDRPAFVPETRISPNRRLIVTVGFVLGLALGILAALAKNWWRSDTRNTLSE